MTIGIYCIINLSTNKYYYGSSMNIEKRFNIHKTLLCNNTHCNIHLQRAWRKYGMNDFVFNIIETFSNINQKCLFNIEQQYIDQNIGGYNMAPAGGGDIISNHPNNKEIRHKISKTLRKTFSSMTDRERKDRFSRPGETNPNWRNGGISRKKCPNCNSNWIASKNTTCQACRDQSGKNNPFYGKKHSQESIKKMCQAKIGTPLSEKR